jgi:hypothetical protein
MPTFETPAPVRVVPDLMIGHVRIVVSDRAETNSAGCAESAASAPSRAGQDRAASGSAGRRPTGRPGRSKAE